MTRAQALNTVRGYRSPRRWNPEDIVLLIMAGLLVAAVVAGLAG